MTASSEPCTSAFNTSVSVAVSPLRICSKRSSSLAPGLVDTVEAWARVVKRSRCSRASPTVRAIDRSEVTRSSSPAIGGSDSPSTCTGMEGKASLIWSPWSLMSALTRPQAAPATIGSPTRERAPLHDDRRDRATADVEVRLEHGASRVDLRCRHAARAPRRARRAARAARRCRRTAAPRSRR